MTRFSGRFALPLAVVLALALAGVVRGTLAPRRDECPGNEALLDANAFDPPIDLRREGARSTHLERGRLAGVWPAAGERSAPLAVGIVRTWGLPNVVLQPALTLPGRHEADDVQQRLLETEVGSVPVQYAYERLGRRVRVTGYLLAHRGEAIRSPLWTRLREGPSALWSGSWPITVFAVAAQGRSAEAERHRATLDAWLRAAWVHYQKVCRPASQQAAEEPASRSPQAKPGTGFARRPASAGRRAVTPGR